MITQSECKKTSYLKIQDLLKYQLTAKIAELHGILQSKTSNKDKYTDLEQHQKNKLYKKMERILKNDEKNWAKNST